MLISVVVTLYNKKSSIIRTLESIVNQNSNDYEIIVVNDGSTDGGEELVKTFEDSKVILYNQKNQGVSAARNTGVKIANGEWIMFFDADDIMLPNAINAFEEVIYKKENYDIITANFIKVSPNGEKRVHHVQSKSRKVSNNMRDLALGLVCMRVGCMIVKKEIMRTHPFPTFMTREEDLYNSISICRVGKMFSINNIVMEYTSDYAGLRRYAPPENGFIGHLNFDNVSFWELCINSVTLAAAAHVESWDKYARNKYKSAYFYRFIGNVFNRIKPLLHIAYNVVYKYGKE